MELSRVSLAKFVIFLLCCQWCVHAQQRVITLPTQGSSEPFEIGTARDYSGIVTGKFSFRYLEVLHPSSIAGQTDVYLQEYVSGNRTLPSFSGRVSVNGVEFITYFLNANTSVENFVVVNAKPGIASVEVRIYVSSGFYNFDKENLLYREESVEYWWFAAAFYGFLPLILLVTIPPCFASCNTMLTQT